MAATILLAWVCALSLTHLALAVNLSQALALVWLSALSLISLFFCTDLDLLGSAMFAVYTSVFLFLTLFGVFLSSYWAAASQKTNKARLGLAPTLVLGGVLLVGLQAPSTLGALSWFSSYTAEGAVASSPVYTLHLIFYRLFVGETLLINLYLFLGLVVASVALFFYRRPLKKNGLALTITQATLFKVRTLRNFRRQTRRKNNTTARQRL